MTTNHSPLRQGAPTAPTRRAARPNGSLAGLALLAAATELRASLRTPEFAAGAIAIPVILYAMFGLPNADGVLPGGTVVGLVMAVSMCAYGVVSLAIFTFGEDVAKERGRGWTRTLSATPLPTWVYLVGKLANALVLGTVIVAAIASLAFLLGGADLALGTWVQVWLLMLAGVLAFSTLGFAIAFVARPRAAAMIANLVFLPLAFASGFFVPMNQLPQVLRDIAAFLPTFHFGQLAHHLVMPASDVAFWTGAETRPLWVHVVWVAGSAVALGTVALMASRREAVTRRG
ncbi:ABC transporter permease [Tessaracoccus sp. Y1736]